MMRIRIDRLDFGELREITQRNIDKVLKADEVDADDIIEDILDFLDIEYK